MGGTQAEFVIFRIQKSADFLVKCAMLLFDEFTFQAWLHQLTWIWYCIPPARLTSMFWQPLNHEGINVLGMDQKKVLINPNCQRHIFRSNFVTYTGSLSTECNKLRLSCWKEPLTQKKSDFLPFLPEAPIFLAFQSILGRSIFLRSWGGREGEKERIWEDIGAPAATPPQSQPAPAAAAAAPISSEISERFHIFRKF